jgi:hypothetical protein
MDLSPTAGLALIRFRISCIPNCERGNVVLRPAIPYSSTHNTLGSIVSIYQYIPLWPETNENNDFIIMLLQYKGEYNASENS